MILPRIRLSSKSETWAYEASLTGYPRPGIGLVVYLYQPQDPTEAWIVFPRIDKEAGR